MILETSMTAYLRPASHSATALHNHHRQPRKHRPQHRTHPNHPSRPDSVTARRNRLPILLNYRLRHSLRHRRLAPRRLLLDFRHCDRPVLSNRDRLGLRRFLILEESVGL